MSIKTVKAGLFRISRGSENQCFTIFENLSSFNTEITGNENIISGNNLIQKENHRISRQLNFSAHVLNQNLKIVFWFLVYLSSTELLLNISVVFK